MIQELAVTHQALMKVAPIRKLDRRYARWRADGVVISYPRSGRTWLRTLIGHALADYGGTTGDDMPEPLMVARQAGSGLPWISFMHVGSNQPPEDEQRQAPGELRRIRRKRVLLLVRDPRDVVVSYWFHRVRLKGESRSLDLFIRDPDIGLERVIDFMNVWYERQSQVAAFRLLRYEELYGHTINALRDVLAFFGLPDVPRDILARAVEQASFPRMRALSAAGEDQPDRTRGRGARVKREVRRGKIGGYTDYLGDADEKWMNERVRCDLLPVLGYR